MANPNGLTTAQIKPSNPDGPPVEVLFNPSEYNFTRSLNWNMENILSRDVSKQFYTGGQPTTLTMQLFFDSYEKGEDVRKYTEPIWKMTFVDAKTKNKSTSMGRPPFVKFIWGNMWSFEAVITNLALRFTLFLPNGTPVRATMDVMFHQIEEVGLYPRQNPTSGGGDAVKRRTVRPRETLAWIAYEEYRDSTQWRRIADANSLDNPLSLRPGQELVIPPRG